MNKLQSNQIPSGRLLITNVPLPKNRYARRLFARTSVVLRMSRLDIRLCSITAIVSIQLLQVVGVEGQDFTYATNNGTLTLTAYNGAGGAVVIPNAVNGLPVTGIGEAVFMHNGQLTSIIIPENVNRIGTNAFYDTPLTNVTFGNGVITIGEAAFADCKALTSTVIPNSVVNIGNEAFLGSGLNSVTIGKGVTNIEGGAFSFSLLTSITIPDGVTSIGNSAFANCNILGRVRIGNGVTTMGVYVFAQCPSLYSVTLGYGITSIAANAFYTSGLTTITIPHAVTSIGDGAFNFCTRLSKIIVGSGVTNIGSSAFNYCYNLTSAYFQGNAPSADSSVFTNADNVTAYYLPGTAGWGPMFGGRPTMLWNPEVQTTDGSFGVRQNQFGFNIAGTPDIPLVVEASTNLGATSWILLQSCTLTNGLLYFSDPQWKSYSERLYRIRSP